MMRGYTYLLFYLFLIRRHHEEFVEQIPVGKRGARRSFIFVLKISLMQEISFALQAEPIFDRPKIGEKGAATFEARSTKFRYDPIVKLES